MKLFLPLIFGFCCLNHRYLALSVHEVASAWAARAQTVDAVPLLFEVGLNQLEAVQGTHFLRFARTVLARLLTSVMRRILVLLRGRRFSA